MSYLTDLIQSQLDSRAAFCDAGRQRFNKLHDALRELECHPGFQVIPHRDYVSEVTVTYKHKSVLYNVLILTLAKDGHIYCTYWPDVGRTQYKLTGNVNECIEIIAGHITDSLSRRGIYET